MRLKSISCLCLLAVFSLGLQARPAHRGAMTLVQPDGTVLQATLRGDEWGHYLISTDGAALTRDAEGWWCYARYDVLGNLVNTGERAGSPDTPASVIAQSRDIPFDLLRRQAEVRRRAVGEIRAARRRNVRSFLRQEGGPAVRRGLIILAQFDNLAFRYTREDFEALVNGEGPASALAYFNGQWSGLFDFRFDITDIVTLPNGYEHYGRNRNGTDENPAQMIVDACKAVDDAVDFSLYDNDGDGEVDNVFVFFAGPDEAEYAGDDYIWSHQWYVRDGAGIHYSADGKVINNYACTSELMRNVDGHGYDDLASIGTFCHEYTHTFGIPDLYDTDDGNNKDTGGAAECCWYSLDLMDAGNQNNRGYTPPNYSAVERWYFSSVEPWGLSAPVPLTPGEHTLEPVDRNGVYYQMGTDQEGEIFLFECREATGWDEYIGGSGLLIYHIDRSGASLSKWYGNILNAAADHQCVDLVEPDPLARRAFQRASGYDAVHALIPRAVWPYNGTDTFSPSSSPAFQFWSGEDAPLALTGITRNGDGTVSFTVLGDLAEKAPDAVLDDQLVLQDAAIIRWSAADPEFTGGALLRWGEADATTLTEVAVEPYKTGKYACVIEGLQPSTAYKVELCCVSGGLPGKVNSLAAFTTRSLPKSGAYSYIYLKDLPRGDDGSFAAGTQIPLRVYNAPEAESVRWTLDGTEIRPGADGYYTLERSGVLKAVISYPASVEILVKNLLVK